MGASALMSASALAARAEDADPWEGSYVKPALTVPQYLDKVRAEPVSGATFPFVNVNL